MNEDNSDGCEERRVVRSSLLMKHYVLDEHSTV